MCAGPSEREQSRKNLFRRPVVAALLTLHNVISNLLLCKRAATTDTAKCVLSRGGLNVNYATPEYGLYHRVKGEILWFDPDPGNL